MKRILRKMVLGGLMVCIVGVMHPAAAELNFFAISLGDFNEMSKEAQSKCINSVTSGEFDEKPEEEQSRYIAALIGHVEGDENNALMYAANHDLDAAGHYLMIKIGEKFDAAYDDRADDLAVDDLADAMGGCWIESQPERVIQFVAEPVDLADKMGECRIGDQPQSVGLADKMGECRIGDQPQSVDEPNREAEEREEERKEKRKHGNEDLHRAKRSKFNSTEGKVASARAQQSTVQIEGQPQFFDEPNREVGEGERQGKRKYSDGDLHRVKRSKFNSAEDQAASVSAQSAVRKAVNASGQVALVVSAGQKPRATVPPKKRSMMRKAREASGSK